MKLRILDDSIRLRLTRGETAALGRNGWVEGSTAIPGGDSFSYRLEAAEAFGLTLHGPTLTVSVPGALVAAWADSDGEVGMYGRVEADTHPVEIIVEKDFRTFIPRPDVDPADYFPNPKQPRTTAE